MSSATKSFLAIVSLLPIALVSAAACGGSALENRSGSAGSNGLAGTGSTAGSSSSGGSGNSAGAFHGVAGQSSGQAGSAAGGSLGIGGTASGGAANGGGGGLDVSACTSNTQCEVVPVSCCSCGILGPATNFTAINTAYEKQYNSRCAAVDCAGCPPMRAPEPNDPYFYLVATCQRPPESAPNAPGHCVIVDLQKTEITACKSASDCSLRSGTACCSGCNGSPVALNGSQNGALSGLVCPSEPVGCPACAPIFDGYAATCTDGRCRVEQLLD